MLTIAISCLIGAPVLVLLTILAPASWGGDPTLPGISTMDIIYTSSGAVIWIIAFGVWIGSHIRKAGNPPTCWMSSIIRR